MHVHNFFVTAKTILLQQIVILQLEKIGTVRGYSLIWL